MQDDPLVLSLKIAMDHDYQTRAYINNLLHNVYDDIEEEVSELKVGILNSTSSKCITYKEINPDLSVHSVYKGKTHVYEHHRAAFTRFHVSAHSLTVEVGRWNRRGRGRLPLEERLCPCAYGHPVRAPRAVLLSRQSASLSLFLVAWRATQYQVSLQRR
ncbi:hypothetical protein E2C01_067380 [Portunus trituberculatus]|uniref:Uncharacterized protein n=1 Tax=Portunus trituberculatus TaxID=210409 RepID=A0A5B7HNY3_PORTR|nr:hypothetical protein [Portunus trituberculatus]